MFVVGNGQAVMSATIQIKNQFANRRPNAVDAHVVMTVNIVKPFSFVYKTVVNVVALYAIHFATS